MIGKYKYFLLATLTVVAIVLFFYWIVRPDPKGLGFVLLCMGYGFFMAFVALYIIFFRAKNKVHEFVHCWAMVSNYMNIYLTLLIVASWFNIGPDLKWMHTNFVIFLGALVTLKMSAVYFSEKEKNNSAVLPNREEAL